MIPNESELNHRKQRVYSYNKAMRQKLVVLTFSIAEEIHMYMHVPICTEHTSLSFRSLGQVQEEQ